MPDRIELSYSTFAKLCLNLLGHGIIEQKHTNTTSAIWRPSVDLNHGPLGLQPFALPTELPGRDQTGISLTFSRLPYRLHYLT